MLQEKRNRRVHLIMRVLVPNITNKSLLRVVPALEIPPRQLKQVLRWRVFEDGDVLLRDVADAFVVGAVI